MCTAIVWDSNDRYFGRNLDIDSEYGECITTIGRKFPFRFSDGKIVDNHYAIIGMAKVVNNYPLFFDGTNEKGLSIAGLDFPENAYYQSKSNVRANVSPFEFISWILSQCATTSEALSLLNTINLWNVPFSPQLPLAPLHWLIADKTDAYVIEPVKNGLFIKKNEIGVLTNNPPFDYHLQHLVAYRNLTPHPGENRFSSLLPLNEYCYGMGSIGLPGDYSSPSRFVRAAFACLNAAKTDEENKNVTQFFHILNSVSQISGLNIMKNGAYEFTKYSSCCNINTGVYYYKTYGNSQIHAVDLHKSNISGDQMHTYPLICRQQIQFQN